MSSKLYSNDIGQVVHTTCEVEFEVAERGHTSSIRYVFDMALCPSP